MDIVFPAAQEMYVGHAAITGDDTPVLSTTSFRVIAWRWTRDDMLEPIICLEPDTNPTSIELWVDHSNAWVLAETRSKAVQIADEKLRHYRSSNGLPPV